MTLAAVHISPFISIPISIVLALVLAWYWAQLGHADVPRSRRWVRRISLGLSFTLLLAAVVGVSFVDPRAHQSAYVATWSLVIVLILLVMLTAVADIFNSVRLQREYRTRLEIDAAAELHRTIKQDMQAPKPRFDSPTTNGSQPKRSHGAHS